MNMDKQAIQTALDKAIAGVVSDEYREIMGDSPGEKFARGTADAEKRVEVEYAIASLHESLRLLKPPDYNNRLVPLFYSVWYQPFQVNLAYTLIMQIIEQRSGVLTDKEVLHIVDFGCGALAMGIGLIIAALDLRAQGRDIPKFQISLIDTSDNMIRIGALIRKRFVQELSVHPNLSCDGLSFKLELFRNIENIKIESNAECWLTALHAFYLQYQEQVKQDFNNLNRIIKPTTALMTCYRGSQSIVKYVSPFENDAQVCDVPQLRLTGALPITTSWRKLQGESLSDSFAWKYLVSTSQVEWDPARGYNDNVAIIYTGI